MTLMLGNMRPTTAYSFAQLHRLAEAGDCSPAGFGYHQAKLQAEGALVQALVEPNMKQKASRSSH